MIKAADNLPAELELFGTPTTGKILGIGRDSVVQLIKSKKLKASNVGSHLRPRWKVSKAAILEYLDKRSNVKPQCKGVKTTQSQENPYF